MSNRKNLLKELKSALIHLETTLNYISGVSNQFSSRAFNAAVSGEPIDEDTLDMQGMLSDTVEALTRIKSVLNILIERM